MFPPTGPWAILVYHLTATAIVALIAFGLRTRMARNSPRDGFVGWVAFVPFVGGFFAAGFLAWGFRPAFSYGMIALIGSAAAGVSLATCAVLGRLIWWYYHREIEGEPDLTPDDPETP